MRAVLQQRLLINEPIHATDIPRQGVEKREIAFGRASVQSANSAARQWVNPTVLAAEPSRAIILSRRGMLATRRWRRSPSATRWRTAVAIGRPQLAKVINRAMRRPIGTRGLRCFYHLGLQAQPRREHNVQVSRDDLLVFDHGRVLKREAPSGSVEDELVEVGLDTTHDWVAHDTLKTLPHGLEIQRRLVRLAFDRHSGKGGQARARVRSVNSS